MNILGKLFGSDKVIDAGIKGIDAVVFTAEEKSQYQLALLKAYEPFKIAQRLLALTFGVPYAFAWLVTFAVSFKFDVESQLRLLSGDMGTIVMTIVGFYFLGGAAESIFKSRVK
ncbi:hypothetical protein [uncultured Zhongshania sp.]|uniref:hypothetical protein n=1 Tax=uncultured Zhongshania sp. TaxID=1642288 RepID=UPI0030D97A31